MKTLVLEQLQDEILRDYLQAFIAYDVEGMTRHLHPAFHYERMLNGKIELIINGQEDFRTFLNSRVAHLAGGTIQLLARNVERDRTEFQFQVLSNDTQVSTRPLKGSAVFWLLDKLIFHLVVDLKTESK